MVPTTEAGIKNLKVSEHKRVAHSYVITRTSKQRPKEVLNYDTLYRGVGVGG